MKQLWSFCDALIWGEIFFWILKPQIFNLNLEKSIFFTLTQNRHSSIIHCLIYLLKKPIFLKKPLGYVSALEQSLHPNLKLKIHLI